MEILVSVSQRETFDVKEEEKKFKSWLDLINEPLILVRRFRAVLA
jgi:hypothetical protein